MPFRFRTLDIPDLLLVEPVAFEDTRGIFIELYKRSEFATHAIPELVQANPSRSAKGVLRGLHYQKPPRVQGKLVMVLAGEIFDVAGDLRRGSPMYGQWRAVTLSEANRYMLYHVSNRGSCTWQEFASTALALAGIEA